MQPGDPNQPLSSDAIPAPEAGDPIAPKTLYPAVAAALEEGAGTLRERLHRIAARSPTESRYTVIGTVGKGAMGQVLRVWDEVLRRELAMKVVAVRAEGDTQEAQAHHDRKLARFIEEAGITSRLDHPGIVPVHELAIDGDGVYFTMPLVDGLTLHEVFARVRAGDDEWNLHRALDVLRRVCLIVAFAHSRDVLHRDLKPREHHGRALRRDLRHGLGLGARARPEARGGTSWGRPPTWRPNRR